MFETFQLPFMQKALIVGLITGSFFSFLGVYVVLRRIVFVGIALSQIAATGFAFGFLLGVNPAVSSMVLTLIGIIFFSVQQVEKKIPKESVIGLTYALASSLGILFVAKSAQAETHILNLLSGNILTVTNSQIYFVMIIFCIAWVLQYLFYRQFIFVSFDQETASTSGLNTSWWNFLFYFILGFTISIGMETTGVLLTFAYLVVPAITALIFTQKMKNVFIVSITTGLFSTFIGLYLSFKLDLPSSPTIIGIMVLVSILVFITKKLKCEHKCE